MATSTEVSTVTPVDGVADTVVVDTGGETLSDPAIVAADAAAVAAPATGPVVPLTDVSGVFYGTDGAAQTVTNY